MGIIARRQVFRLGGSIALGILCVLALAACVETKVVTREVPVERIVVQEVPVEKVVTREVERLVRVEVPVERVVIREIPVERVVTREIERVVRVEVPVARVVTKEAPVERPATAEATEAVEEVTDDRVCETNRTSVIERVVNREFPSVFGAWSHVLLNLPIPDDKWEFDYVERTRAYHDLFWAGMGHGLQWASTPHGIRVVGPWSFAQEQKNRLQDQNPNWLHLVPIYHYGAHPELYPEDWPYWLRDESGNRVADEGWAELLIDYTHPAAQDHFVQQAIAVAKCGVFDGIFMDWWTQEEDSNLEIAHLYHGNRISAEVSMLRRIREAVGDDFLIVVNSRTEKIPLSAPYVNGAFMEGHRRHTREYLTEVESTLLWAEENFRYPQVNGYEAWSILEEPLDSPRNQQWMRVFTTLSLTHSNGYVSYVIGFDGALSHQHGYEVWEGHAAEHAAGEPHEHTHEKSWHSFWDASLGRPVGERGRLYEDREGLFIREFTNGWAVYNRSGIAQEIRLPESAIGIHSGLSGTSHSIPDLDGEIYIKGSSDA
ncbi:MAG: putative glycoside hydrolase [Chloroflexota bacterium]|nr:putative glycoside hydrolase [Chloroflexota bacterium]MDE2919412.1 putative glycoside hydrolase [Chloroflexota bacterium]